MINETKLPSILVTGASGFIGSYLIDYFKEDYKIYAIARRSRKEASIPYHPNLHWMQCDISNPISLNEALDYVSNEGGVDFIVHLAAYYDFTYKDNPIYDIVNVNGTKNMLESAKRVGIRRFIFASSLAACEFPTDGELVTEKTPPNANYYYARSKKVGEELVKVYSKYFPCSVIRFAAVFSDWCEFAPLYKFLLSWLTKNIYSRMFCGKGESAIPYIHIRDLCQLLKIIFNKSNVLPNFDIYSASPDASTSHREIFEISTRYFFGEPIKPIPIPKLIAYPGLVLKYFLKFILFSSEKPFEKLWMIKYIDKKLNIDSSYTREKLDWKPTERYYLTRRLLFLLEKMKSHPDEWHVKNEAALKRIAKRTNLIIYEKMIEQKEAILTKIITKIIYQDSKEVFSQYKQMDSNDFQCYISAIYHLLLASIRSSDRSLFLQYIDKIAIRRFAEGYESQILCNTLKVFNDIIVNHLISYKELSNIKQELYDNVGLTMQIAQDEIEDLYDGLIEKMPGEILTRSSMLPDCKELQKIIRQLSAFYQISPEESSYYEDMK